MAGQFIPDTALQSGDVVGFNAGQSTEGKYSAREAFGELLIPVIEDNFIHRLELNGGRATPIIRSCGGGGVMQAASGRDDRDTSSAAVPEAVRAPPSARCSVAPRRVHAGRSLLSPRQTTPRSVRCVRTGGPSSNVGRVPQPNARPGRVAVTRTCGRSAETSRSARFCGRAHRGSTHGRLLRIKIDSAIATAGGGVTDPELV